MSKTPRNISGHGVECMDCGGSRAAGASAVSRFSRGNLLSSTKWFSYLFVLHFAFPTRTWVSIAASTPPPVQHVHGFVNGCHAADHDVLTTSLGRYNTRQAINIVTDLSNGQARLGGWRIMRIRASNLSYNCLQDDRHCYMLQQTFNIRIWGL